MTDLVLSEADQAAVRAVLSSDPERGPALPGEGVLRPLGQLITCDAMGIALLDATGLRVGESGRRDHRRRLDDLPVEDGPIVLGISHRHRLSFSNGTNGTNRTNGTGDLRVAFLTLGVRSGPSHVVKLWLVRRTTDFTARERALFALVVPALERLLRERPKSALPPSLTTQERRVLHLLSTGLSNAEIAHRLVITPGTVRKHLENAYRKLGVSNRLAAVTALEGGTNPASAPVVSSGRR